MFAIIAVLTLSLGIGATTAIFSVVNGVLINPLPYPHSGELVAILHHAPGANFGGDVDMSPSMLFTYREENHVFQSLGGWSPDSATVTGLGTPERTRTLLVTSGIFQALDVPPLLGRWLSQNDDTPGASETVLLSYGYWQRRFGGDPGAIGHSITVDARPRQIVGVMPESFFRLMGQDPDLFIPLQLDRNRVHLGDLGFLGIARLRRGVSVAQANADVARMLPIWLRSWPAPNGAGKEFFEQARFNPALRPLKDEVVGTVGSVLWLIMGTVGLVFLIACANVANLLLVKAESRRLERSIRLALGASRAQILRESLAESLLLATASGLLGLALAGGGLRALRFMQPANLPRLDEISIDGSVVLFALVVSLFSCLLFGLLPALKYVDWPFVSTLRTGSRSATASREGHGAQDLLVVGQVSLALVLLVTSGLMIRTFQALRKVQPGFTKPEQVQVFRLTIPASQVKEPERAIRMLNDILDRLAAVPGVSAAGLTNSLPMDDTKNQNQISAEGTPNGSEQSQRLRTFKFVSPGLLGAIGTRLIAGRALDWTDIQRRRSVVMVSENLARELWGSPSAALGKRIHEWNAKPQWREVVGVVENVRDDGAQKQPPTTVYWPFVIENFSGESLNVQRDVAFAVRSPRVETETFLKQIREAVGSVNPNLPLARIQTLQQIYRGSMAQTSFVLVILAIAGSMALVLGIVGVYGVIAYTVAHRRREVGIRMALGAQPAAVKWMFLRHGLLLSCSGIALGLAAIAALSRLMSSLLFGVTAFDPATYAVTAATLLIAALVATYIPAHRGASVNPIDTLRAE
jgi:predicted permease